MWEKWCIYFIILQVLALHFVKQQKPGFRDVVLLAAMAKKVTAQIWENQVEHVSICLHLLGQDPPYSIFYTIHDKVSLEIALVSFFSSSYNRIFLQSRRHRLFNIFNNRLKAHGNTFLEDFWAG